MSTPTVGAYVKIPADCDISYSFGADGDVEVLFGDIHDGFEAILAPEALAKLAVVADQALSVPADPDPEQTSTLTNSAVA